MNRPSPTDAHESFEDALILGKRDQKAVRVSPWQIISWGIPILCFALGVWMILKPSPSELILQKHGLSGPLKLEGQGTYAEMLVHCNQVWKEYLADPLHAKIWNNARTDELRRFFFQENPDALSAIQGMDSQLDFIDLVPATRARPPAIAFTVKSNQRENELWLVMFYDMRRAGGSLELDWEVLASQKSDYLTWYAQSDVMLPTQFFLWCVPEIGEKEQPMLRVMRSLVVNQFYHWSIPAESLALWNWIKTLTLNKPTVASVKFHKPIKGVVDLVEMPLDGMGFRTTLFKKGSSSLSYEALKAIGREHDPLLFDSVETPEN